MDKLLFLDEQIPLADKIIKDCKKYALRSIAIGGLSGTGKTEVAHLIKKRTDWHIKIISQDEYYIKGYEKKRLEDINNVGLDEIDWVRLNNAVGNNIFSHQYNLVIVEGLYALRTRFVERKYFIDRSLENSYKFRKKRGKENPDDNFRKKVLEKESIVVNDLRKRADIILKYKEDICNVYTN